MWRPTLLLLALFAGCLNEPASLTSPLMLEIHNDTDSPTQGRFAVYEAYGSTIVYERVFELNAGERILVERIELLEGSYRMRTESSGLERDADVRLTNGDSFRFVILEDIIAFQRVTP